MTRDLAEALLKLIMQIMDALRPCIDVDHLSDWDRSRSAIEATQFVELLGDEACG